MSRTTVGLVAAVLAAFWSGEGHTQDHPRKDDGRTRIDGCRAIEEPGSFVLARNLTAAGDCLVLKASFVTIDLAGFTITGNGTGVGICTTGFRRGITVRDGGITRFNRAVDFRTGSELLIERMQITGNSFGISTNEGAIVRDNVVARNGRGSISHDGINVGARSIVTGNISNFNTGTGIVVGNASVIVGNAASVNGNNGLVASGTGSTVRENTANSNSNFGLSVDCPGNVTGNTTTNNKANLLLQGAGCSDLNNVVDL